MNKIELIGIIWGLTGLGLSLFLFWFWCFNEKHRIKLIIPILK